MNIDIHMQNISCLLCNNLTFSGQRQFIIGIFENQRDQQIFENASSYQLTDELMMLVKTRRLICKNCQKGSIRCRICNYATFLTNNNSNKFECQFCQNKSCLKCGQEWELYLNQFQENCSKCQLRMIKNQKLLAFFALIIVTPVVPFFVFFYFFFTQDGSSHFINYWFKYAALILVCVIFPVAYVCVMIGFFIYKIRHYEYFVFQLQQLGLIKE